MRQYGRAKHARNALVYYISSIYSGRRPPPPQKDESIYSRAVVSRDLPRHRLAIERRDARGWRRRSGRREAIHFKNDFASFAGGRSYRRARPAVYVTGLLKRPAAAPAEILEFLDSRSPIVSGAENQINWSAVEIAIFSLAPSVRARMYVCMPISFLPRFDTRSKFTGGEFFIASFLGRLVIIGAVVTQCWGWKYACSALNYEIGSEQSGQEGRLRARLQIRVRNLAFLLSALSF